MTRHQRVATAVSIATARPVPCPCPCPSLGLALGLACSASALAGSLLVGPFVGRAAATQPNPSPAPSERALMAQARKDLLNLSELPAGWTVQKGSGNSGNSGNSGDTGNSGSGQGADDGYEMLVRVSSCAGIPRSQLNANPPTANGKTFQSNDQTIQVNDQVGVFGTAAQAQRFLAVWSNPKVAFCLRADAQQGKRALPSRTLEGHEARADEWLGPRPACNGGRRIRDLVGDAHHVSRHHVESAHDHRRRGPRPVEPLDDPHLVRGTDSSATSRATCSP